MLLFIVWIIFDPIKFSWPDDPFQKVVLAPLGEEPFKLLLAFLSCYVVLYLIRCSSKSISRSIAHTHNRIIDLVFPTVFFYFFIPFSIISAVSFGIGEGSFQNIILHVSLSSLAAILVVVIFTKVKNKHWRPCYKLFSILSTISLPMILHSISNQYANISYADNHPEFGYLVVIGRYFKNHTFLNNQAMYTIVVFVIRKDKINNIK